MKLELKSLRSKIAQKIFTLFVLAAFIPLVIVSFISYRHISDQLQSDTRRNVFRESKALGALLLDRLIAARTGLGIIQNSLSKNRSSREAINDEWIREIFSGIYIVFDDGEKEIFAGDYREIRALPPEQRQFLSKGDAILQLDYDDMEDSRLFLIKEIIIENRQGLIVGQLNRKYIWNFNIYPPQIACVLSPDRLPVACSELTFDENLLLNSLFSNREDRQLFYFSSPSDEYAAMTWSLFLDAEFHSKDLVALIAIPRKTIFTVFENYKSVFPQALLLTGMFVALLSLIHIRRYMEPVEKLMEGTKRVGKGIFNQPVSVKSGDELEALSESFNDMASQIDEHINIIKLLADLDTLLLSTRDADYIVETLIIRLNKILNSDHVIVVRLSDEIGENTALLNINRDKNFEKIQTENIKISSEEISELSSEKMYLFLTSADDRSYTRHAKELGDNYFYIFPVYINEKLAGIICFGNSTKMEISDRKAGLMSEVADHIAVVLSNSAWEERLEKQIYFDSLTGLPNVVHFKESVDEAIIQAKTSNSHVAILLIDLDRFRIINDSLGHKTGDVILCEIAAMIKAIAPSNMTLFKMSGDEFAFLIADERKLYKAYSQSARLAMKIIDAMKKPFLIEDREIYMTASMGISIFPQDGESLDALMKSAVSAIDRAREIGPGNYEFHDEDKDDDALRSLDISNQLRKGLSNNELVLYYQPKVDCKTGRINAAEALIRWNHPEQGFLAPGSFINIAEESGLIVPIGYHIIDIACQQCKEWLDNGIDIKVAVNLSAEQFRQPDLISYLEKVIRKNSLPAKNLELEITERTTFENHERTIEVLNRLKGYGLSLSIDDFGTGYSSMSYLLQLPVDSLKIDQSFVRGLPGSEDSVSIVKAIIAMAHGLNLRVVAEGVEDESQYQMLEAMKCEEIQGYYISKPLSPDDFRDFVMDFNTCEA